MISLREINALVVRKPVLLAINLSLLALVLIVSVVIVRDLFQGTALKGLNDAVVSAPGSKPRAAGDLMQYAVILENNPFGFEAGKLTSLSSLQGGGAQQPVVNYKLVGTIAGGENSFAILATQEGKQLLFRIHDFVPGLGIISRVESNRILLGEGGATEMKLAEIRGIEKIVDVTRRAPSSGDKGENFVRRAGDDSFELNSKMVQESINNPQRLMTDARLLPLFKDGQQEGFVLREVKPGGIYDSLGLRNGDVLLRINEYNITNPESALQAFTALRGVERLQLDIMRDDSPVTLTYMIK